ncbi:MAG: hypothetical protein WC814_01780 [Candidatus Paceibacterota bacterium]|jgi:hypothetical protein
MSFFGDFFRTQRTESVALIDIGAASVAGAYVQYAPDTQPVLLYTRRLPIERRDRETHERAMFRALEVLGAALIREGAPALLRATGSGSINAVLVSVDAPWQKTSIRTEYFERKTPFTFSKKLVSAALEKTSAAAPGELLVDESIIGTILNGYETRDPYGKEVHRASVVILTSRIDEHVAGGITSLMRSLYHTKHILSIAGSSLRYQAMRIAFPHEREALILDATGPLTSLALVRRDLLVDVVNVRSHTNGTHAWLKEVLDELAELAEKFPLPRTIFLLAPASEIESLRKMLDTTDLGKLWLSDNPPKIVSVMGSHLSGLVRQATTASPDLSLLLMALYFRHRNPEG